MIPAPPGITARYKHQLPDGRHYWEDRRVVAFDDEGRALVVEDEESPRAALVAADSIGRFDGLCDETRADRDYDGDLTVTQVIPAAGWRVNDPEGEDRPLVGWALRVNGALVPVAWYGFGSAMTLSKADGEVYYAGDR